MDKEIIIDGVDVSECDSYTSNYREPMPYGEIKVTEHYCWHINSNCDGKDCDFKQIKRLQAENFELKNSLEICRGLCKTLENAKVNEHNRWFNRCCEINTECDKYRSTLQEIRDITDENKDTAQYRGICLSILAKINEVIGAE